MRDVINAVPYNKICKQQFVGEVLASPAGEHSSPLRDFDYFLVFLTGGAPPPLQEIK